MSGWMLFFSVIFFLICSVSARASDYYIAPDGKAANDGSRDAPLSLARANAVLEPGDTAILLDGEYLDVSIEPAVSGREGEVITYRAEKRHGAVFGETASGDTRSLTAAFLDDRSYIVIVVAALATIAMRAGDFYDAPLMGTFLSLIHI